MPVRSDSLFRYAGISVPAPPVDAETMQPTPACLAPLSSVVIQSASCVGLSGGPGGVPAAWPRACGRRPLPRCSCISVAPVMAPGSMSAAIVRMMAPRGVDSPPACEGTPEASAAAGADPDAIPRPTPAPNAPKSSRRLHRVCSPDFAMSSSSRPQKSYCTPNFTSRPSRICVGCSHGVLVTCVGVV